jgi:hypothetical protein
VNHSELLFAIVSLVTVSIAAPMLIAWWNTRLRIQEREREKARREGINTANEVHAQLLARVNWLTERLEQHDRESDEQ